MANNKKLEPDGPPELSGVEARSSMAPRRRSLKRIVLWAFAILFGLGVASGAGSVLLLLWDESPPDDSDLTPYRRDVTHCLLALRLYELDTEQLPETLDALVPEYLQSVPVDPFDGKPIGYNRAEKILYSVGIDAVDDGGCEDAHDFPEEIGDPLEPTFLITF